jgi:hypothetical protein
MQLWYLKKIWVNVSNHRHKKSVSGSILCRHDRGMLAKYADIWLSGRHVADMSAPFPAKATTMALTTVMVGMAAAVTKMWRQQRWQQAQTTIN